MQARGSLVLVRRIQAVVHHTHTVVSTLKCTDTTMGREWKKMGHKHVGWHGNIAMGLHEIARSRGRFEGVNRRISGKSSGLARGLILSRLSGGGRR